MISRQSGIGPGRDAKLRPLYRAVIILSLCLTVRAQNENITCSIDLRSPTGAVPCTSLSRVLTSCTGSPRDIRPIIVQPLGLYGPPSGNSTTLGCECTDVVYNLFSACAACQKGDSSTNWYSHDQWFQTCPPDRPNVTITSDELHEWNTFTYLPTFDVATALNLAQGLPPPEPSDSSSVTQGNPDGTLNSNSSKHSSSKTGPIVGGVVGGVAFIAIVGFLLFFCIRKRRSRRVPPSAEFMKYAQSQGINNANVPLTHMSQSEEDPRSSQSHAPGRNSIINLTNTNVSTRSPSALGASRNNTDEGDAPPAFTTGLFKDPIFEKGVALNLAGAASGAGVGGPGSASPTGPNPLSQTPVTYSPATPSTFHPENQRLIHGRQMSS